MLLAGGSATAHHSAVMFDVTTCRAVKGAMRTLEWQNPHSWIWINVPGAGGTTEVWGFEFPAPAQLIALDKRWSPRVVAKGEMITIGYSPLKDGRHGGLLNALTLADGKVLHGAPNAAKCEQQNWPRNAPAR
jgi:hypothetical protein